jgi:hypothetical protein
MRMTLKSLTAGAFVSLATVVIIGMSNVGLADAISDTVTVKDTLGKINGTLNINEAQEPISKSVDIPQTIIPIGVDENAKEPRNSDTLTIMPFPMSLFSDSDKPGKDTGESLTKTITITANSDVNTGASSDTLTVSSPLGTKRRSIAEKDEPGIITVEGGTMSFRLRPAEGGTSMPSAPNQTDGSPPVGSIPLSGLSSWG